MATDTTSDAGTASTNEPLYVDGQSRLDDIVAENDVVLTDFYADWCGPCQMLELVVETLAAETDATEIRRIVRYCTWPPGTICTMISKFSTVLVRGTAGSALLFPVTGIATAQMDSGYSGWMGSGMAGYGWWPILWTLVLLSVVLIVGYAIYTDGRTPRLLSNHRRIRHYRRFARYARGEISEEEFEERRRRLEK